MWGGREYRWMYYLTGLPRWVRGGYPYAMPWLGRCFWFPWLPRWWWAGIYPEFQALSKEDEVKMLKEEAAALEEELKEIRKRLQELEK